MKKMFSILTGLFACYLATGQRAQGLLAVQQGSIQTVAISDTFLLQKLDDLIARHEGTDSVFKKYGYIRATINRAAASAASGGKSGCLELSVSYYYYYPDLEASRFPLYVAERNGRLIVFYDPLVQQQGIRQKTKKRFCKKINAHLAPAVIQRITDDNGKVQKLRPVGDISLGQAEVICY